MSVAQRRAWQHEMHICGYTHTFSLGGQGEEGLGGRDFLPGFPEAVTGMESQSRVPEAGRAPLALLLPVWICPM